MRKFTYLMSLIVLLSLTNGSFCDDEVVAIDQGTATLESQVFFGKVHVVKKRDSKEDIIDLVSFELQGRNADKIPAMILIFSSKEKEQKVQAQNGKTVWIEGFLGFSGQRSFIFVNNILVRQ